MIFAVAQKPMTASSPHRPSLKVTDLESIAFLISIHLVNRFFSLKKKSVRADYILSSSEVTDTKSIPGTCHQGNLSPVGETDVSICPSKTLWWAPRRVSVPSIKGEELEKLPVGGVSTSYGHSSVAAHGSKT